MALQSAAFSAAVTNNTYRAFYVFEFLIDEEYWYIIKTDGSMKKSSACSVCIEAKYSLQGTTQGNDLTGGVPPVRFSM